MLDSIKSAISNQFTILWVIGFVGVCTLVALDKVKPDTIEYMLFAMGGAVVSKKKEEGQ